MSIKCSSWILLKEKMVMWRSTLHSIPREEADGKQTKTKTELDTDLLRFWSVGVFYLLKKMSDERFLERFSVTIVFLFLIIINKTRNNNNTASLFLSCSALLSSSANRRWHDEMIYRLSKTRKWNIDTFSARQHWHESRMCALLCLLSLRRRLWAVYNRLADFLIPRWR